MYVDFTSPIMKSEAIAVYRKPMETLFRPGVSNLQELFDDDKIIFGVRKNGAIINHLLHSKLDQDIRFRMRITEFKSTNKDGIEWVRKEFTHVFLLETPAAEWALSHWCDLKGFKTGIFQRYYALALPTMSPYRDKINWILHQMHDDNSLRTLQNKWWRNTCGGSQILNPPFVLILLISVILIPFIM